jgi:radical SAM superfamily enzyme YgiQ (UPF0313 family)
MAKPLVALIGAEFEENLSIRYLASAVEADGFKAVIIPFNESNEARGIVQRVRDLEPLVVCISVPFQARAPELLALAEAIKGRGSSRALRDALVPSAPQGRGSATVVERGAQIEPRVPEEPRAAGRLEGRGHPGDAPHIAVGGHFATFEYRNILRDYPAVDSVVRHEGEFTVQAICARVQYGAGVVAVPGTVVRCGQDICVGEKNPLPPLDILPYPDRRGEPHDVLGVPTSPIVGSRGCYADCSFCCIYAYAENAEGARYRMRSPESIAAEMKSEYAKRGIRIFVFHDDNFFVPSEKKNIARYSRLKELLHEHGMDDIGLVIKCRPNDVHPRLFKLLKSMGMIRAYVGIESNSPEGVVSLNRRITSKDNRKALKLLKALDVYCSFNVLIFDPDATMEGVLTNLRFMRKFADIPFNFCRAEVYAGTPLKKMLEADGRLKGDYMAWGYEMRDRRVELLFRIATTAFMSRNFKPDGVHNLNMGIRFDNEVMRRFYPDCWDKAWHAGLVDLSRRIGINSVMRMRQAHEFVSSVDLSDNERVKAFTLELARRINRADLGFVQEIKQLRREMELRIGTAETAETAGTAEGAVGAGEVEGAEVAEAPVWAAETVRLSRSVGKELSTEILPAPKVEKLGA